MEIGIVSDGSKGEKSNINYNKIRGKKREESGAAIKGVLGVDFFQEFERGYTKRNSMDFWV